MPPLIYRILTFHVVQNFIRTNSNVQWQDLITDTNLPLCITSKVQPFRRYGTGIKFANHGLWSSHFSVFDKDFLPETAVCTESWSNLPLLLGKWSWRNGNFRFIAPAYKAGNLCRLPLFIRQDRSSMYTRLLFDQSGFTNHLQIIITHRQNMLTITLRKNGIKNKLPPLFLSNAFPDSIYCKKNLKLKNRVVDNKNLLVEK